MSMRGFLFSTTAGLLMLPALAGQVFAQSPEFELTLHHFLGPNAPAHAEMLVPWAESIEEASGGRIDIEVYPSMSLGGSPPQLFRQVADGVVDMIWVVNGYTPGLFPRTEVFELPTVFTGDIAAANLAMNELFDEYLAPDFEDVKLLFLHVHAGNAIHTSDIRVQEVSDLAGANLRVPGPTANAVIEAMGATPVTMPVPDLPQALATNNVQGALIPWEIIPSLQLQQSTDYQIEGPDNQRFGTTTFQVSMNLDTWNSLPEDLQQIFNEHTDEEWLREIADTWRAADDAGLELAVSSGNEHVVLTEEQMANFNEALAPVVDQWVADHADQFDAQALVDAARAAIEENES